MRHTHKHTCKCSHSTYTPTHVPTRSVNTYRARTDVHTHARTHPQAARGARPSPHGVGLLRAAHRGSDGRHGLRSPPCLQSSTGSLLSG